MWSFIYTFAKKKLCCKVLTGNIPACLYPRTFHLGSKLTDLTLLEVWKSHDPPSESKKTKWIKKNRWINKRNKTVLWFTFLCVFTLCKSNLYSLCVYDPLLLRKYTSETYGKVFSACPTAHSSSPCPTQVCRTFVQNLQCGRIVKVARNKKSMW